MHVIEVVARYATFPKPLPALAPLQEMKQATEANEVKDSDAPHTSNIPENKAKSKIIAPSLLECIAASYYVKIFVLTLVVIYDPMGTHLWTIGTVLFYTVLHFVLSEWTITRERGKFWESSRSRGWLVTFAIVSAIYLKGAGLFSIFEVLKERDILHTEYDLSQRFTIFPEIIVKF